MPLPPNLLEQLRGRRFWTDAYWITEAVDDGRTEETLRFEVSDRHALVLTFDSAFACLSLGLSTDGAESVEIAWDDQAHFHPHLLRWRELDAIGQAIATVDPTLPHPGIPLLLLMRFAPITDDEDGWLANDLIDRAWDSLGLFSERERQAFFDLLDVRGSRFRWRRLANTYVLEQDENDEYPTHELYTLRAEDNREFPFGSFDAMMAALPPSTRLVRRTTLPERETELSITLSHSSEFPGEAARFAALFLDRALRDAAVGRAEVAGNQQAADGTPISSFLRISVRGDERLACSKVATLLHAIGALASASSSAGALVPATDPRLYVQLCNLEIARWILHGKAGARFDRPSLSGAQRTAIAETLDRLGFEPQGAAGLRTCSSPDGSKVVAALPDLLTDENLDGGSLWLDQVTIESVGLVYELMQAATLFVAYPLVAPNAALAGSIDLAWPGTHVATDATALFQLLQRDKASHSASHHAAPRRRPQG